MPKIWKFINGKLKDVESVKEITDRDRIERLETVVQDLGEVSLKPFAIIEDDKWYRVKVVAVNRGTYRTSNIGKREQGIK